MPWTSPLIQAARQGDTIRIAQLAAAGADLDEPGGVNGWTPLMHAVHKDQLGSARTLIEAGADINALSPRGETALMMAAGYGDTEMVALLLDRGADPYLEDQRGATALAAAAGGTSDIDLFTIGRCRTDTVKVLIERDPELRSRVDPWSLRAARWSGCKDVLTLLQK